MLVFVILIRVGSVEASQPRIVGGLPVKSYIPYQISLQARLDDGPIGTFVQLLVEHSTSAWTHFCGGSIITETHVLTAAHCMDAIDYNRVSVVVGTSTRLQGGRRHLIETFVNHAEYKKLETNDISVIKVKEPFVLGPKVKLIEFRSMKRIGGNVRVRLSGWGYTAPLITITLPNGLRTINLKTLSNDECRRVGYNVTNAEICTSSGFMKGACMGDSGGPLVNAARTLVIGVVSYGSRICGIGLPEVYTRVSEFVSWIEEQINVTSSSTTTSIPTSTLNSVTSVNPTEATPSTSVQTSATTMNAVSSMTTLSLQTTTSETTTSGESSTTVKTDSAEETTVAQEATESPTQDTTVDVIPDTNKGTEIDGAEDGGATTTTEQNTVKVDEGETTQLVAQDSPQSGANSTEIITATTVESSEESATTVASTAEETTAIED
ncbi:unnamed protein product [Hermetia illucens]|uniref:Peptidase S1 domain-containing protein n=2 Tax=Hermetia illucens TaxID=343691 RepID=A0A7R8Z189_HERIL|nr:unnamed protein product [Hermetia illucens]